MPPSDLVTSRKAERSWSGSVATDRNGKAPRTLWWKRVYRALRSSFGVGSCVTTTVIVSRQEALREAFSQLEIPVRWPGDVTPNMPPRDDIHIGEAAPIARMVNGAVELSVTPWAWKTPTGKPVFNFRSEGRRFGNSDRCVIAADGFYEFTAAADAKRRLKEKHLFTISGEPWFWIAGLVKDGAFTIVTTAPGPGIAPYHDRQIVVLPRWQGREWLELSRPEAELLQPLPAGSLHHEQVR